MDNPETTFNLSRGPITLTFLQTAIEVANKYGEIKIVNVGETDLFLLASDLLDYAKAQEKSRKKE